MHLKDLKKKTPAELVEMAEERETPAGAQLGVESNGVFFPVGPAGAHRL